MGKLLEAPAKIKEQKKKESFVSTVRGGDSKQNGKQVLLQRSYSTGEESLGLQKPLSISEARSC